MSANRLGDAVLSSGLLAHLIDAHPGSRITLACGPAAAPLFAATPDVVRLVTLAKKPWAGHWFGLWRTVMATRWDIIVDLRGSALAWSLRARRRFVLRRDDGPIHRTVMYSRLLALRETAAPRLFIAAAHRARAAALIPVAARALALGPTANWAGKRWPLASFVGLIERLTAPGTPFHGAPVAVLGAPGERSYAEAVLAAVPSARRIDLVGGETLLTLAACLERCALYVGNDSGLMHLAAASGVPTLGLFGPSREVHYAPWAEHADTVRTPESFEEIVGAPGYDRRAGHSLMATLEVETVARSALALAARAAGAAERRARTASDDRR